MSMVVIMFAYKKQIKIKNGERSGILFRPDYMMLSRYDSKRKRFRRRRIIPLSHNQLPEDIADLLTNPDTYTIAWTDDEITILKTLLNEMGISARNVHTDLVTGFLKAHTIPYKSLTQTAQALGVSHHCPRECVQSLEKVKNRFDVLRRVIKYLIQLNDILLIDGIWV